MVYFSVWISTASIVGFLAVRFFDGPRWAAILFFTLAVVAVGALLLRLFMLSVRAQAERPDAFPREARAHILAHAVPAAYLIAQYFVEPTYLTNALCWPAVVFFFWTGRKTWQGMHQRFGAKLYKIFVKGNTGVMCMMTMMLILGAIYKPEFGEETFRRVFLAYFAVHLLLTGPTVLKIERDLRHLSSINSVPR